MAIKWQCNGNTAVIQCQYSVNTVAIQWQYSGNKVAIQWQYSGNVLAMQCQYSVNTVRIQWQYSGNTVSIQCQYSGNKVAMQWQYSYNSWNAIFVQHTQFGNNTTNTCDIVKLIVIQLWTNHTGTICSCAKAVAVWQIKNLRQLQLPNKCNTPLVVRLIHLTVSGAETNIASQFFDIFRLSVIKCVFGLYLTHCQCHCKLTSK